MTTPPSPPAIRHLYFHIPFCAKLCPYCSFYVDTHFKNKSRRFLDALLREVKMQCAEIEIRPETIYLGGGTPSALSISELDFLLNCLRDFVAPANDIEWTIEVNPATVSPQKARLLRNAGVSRASIGAQSWDESVLKTLGRIHTVAQAERTFATLRDAGFENINLDLMFAVPGQTAAQWLATLEKSIALKPEHISAYCLTYEEDTAFFERLRTGEFLKDDDRDADMFEIAINELEAAGFAHYEISNYARPGCESRHNLAYWSGADYLGFGPSAFSTCGGRRWQNVADTAAYTARILAGEPAVYFEEQLAATTRLGERIAFSLRTDRGVSRSELTPWQREVAEFEALGLLQADADRVVLTRKGKLLADAVAEVFV
jgi:oxygen-independent coproporphyrinogen-3 oxidase